MKTALALIMAASCLASPAFALSDQTSHYTNPSAQSDLTDPDEKTGFDDGSAQAGQLSGREQTLLNAPDNMGRTSFDNGAVYAGSSFGGESGYSGYYNRR